MRPNSGDLACRGFVLRHAQGRYQCGRPGSSSRTPVGWRGISRQARHALPPGADPIGKPAYKARRYADRRKRGLDRCSHPVAGNPYVIRDDIAALWMKALAIAADATIVWPVRGHAASICLLVAAEVDYDDALALTAVTAAATMLECAPYVRDLLVAAREIARDDSVLLDPMLKLAAAAHAAGRSESVVVALLGLLQLPGFTGDVPLAWLVDACVVTFEADDWLRRVVRRWVARFGAGHEGVRAIVRDRGDLWFPTSRFTLGILRALHAAEPTSAGWVALARRRAEIEPGPLGLSFGGRGADALATLKEAQLRQLDPPVHVTLDIWLRELGA